MPGLRPLVAPDGDGGLPAEMKEGTEVMANEHPGHRGDPSGFGVLASSPAPTPGGLSFRGLPPRHQTSV